MQLKVVVLFFAFLSSNYSMFIINPEMLILDNIIHLSALQKSLFSTAAIIGIVLGELVFGHVADGGLGAGKALVVALSLVILGSLSGSAGLNISILVVSRFIIGVGIGGAYPLSATISSQVFAASTIPPPPTTVYDTLCP